MAAVQGRWEWRRSKFLDRHLAAARQLSYIEHCRSGGLHLAYSPRALANSRYNRNRGGRHYCSFQYILSCLDSREVVRSGVCVRHQHFNAPVVAGFEVASELHHLDRPHDVGGWDFLR
jgi:hypothetical protein